MATMTVEGNLTRDPELTFAATGTAVCKFSVAENRRVQNNGVWEDGKTTFHNITTFGQLAENVAASLRKGDRTIVFGRYDVDEYDRKDAAGNPTGEKGRWHSIIADVVGPSLKWATAEVTRNERKPGNGAEAGPTADEAVDTFK